MKLQSLKKDSKNNHLDDTPKSRSDLVQIIKKNKFIKQFNLSIFIDNKKPL